MPKESVQKVLSTLDDTVTASFNEHNLPGLAVGVVYRGELAYSKCLGYANLEKEQPVTSDTHFRIMSISKTFTGIGIMQLVEQGKLSLDDPANQHLRAFKIRHDDPDTPPVTIRNLLTHTSGIGETRSLLDLRLPVVGLAAKPESPTPALREYYKGRLRAEIAPGIKWSYSNHAFAALGQIIADVSGEPFPEYMIRHVFEPLGMFETDYLRSERVRSTLAQGYNWKKDQWMPYPYLRLETTGCGAIFSSLNEMVKYTSALMNGGKNGSGRVLKAVTLESMYASQLKSDPDLFSMGLAFFLLDHQFNGKRVVEHSGGWPDFISEMLVAPDDKIAVLVFTNCGSHAPTLIGADILRRLLEVPNPLEHMPDNHILETPSDWPNLTGFYGPLPGILTNARVWMSMGGEVEVYVRDGQLYLRSLYGSMAKGTPLYRADSKNPLLYQGSQDKSPFKVSFKKNAQGEIERIEMDENVFYKRPFRQSLRLRALAVGGTLLVTAASLLISILRGHKRR